MNKTENNAPLRMTGIDAVAGIMILDMILLHCYSFPFQIYLSFFMPWFFFKSGMFFKHESVKDCVQKSAKKLLYPYVTFSIVGCILYFISILLKGDYDWTHYTIDPVKELFEKGALPGNLPLWFLLTFFLVRVIFSFAENNTKYPFVVAIPAFIVAYLLYINDNPLPRYFGNVSTGLVFYSLGYILRDKQNLPFVWIISIVVYLLFAILGVSYVDMFPNTLMKGDYLLWFVFSIAGCITFNTIFEKIPYKSKILTWVGKNSMIIYATHFLVIDIYYIVTEPFNIDSRLSILGLFATMIIAEYFIVKLFKKPQMQFMIKPKS